MIRILFFSIIIISSNSFAQSFKDILFSYKLDTVLSNVFLPGSPGGSVMIIQRDKLIYSKSFGLADVVSREKFSEKTVANTGSITKTFVAYAILILQKQGKLSIEDSIEKYFPDFKNKEIARKVKIKHLLNHTSGIPDLREVDKDSVYYLTANDEQNFAPLKQADSLLFEPGTDWKYSNPAYNGLALIIEKVSGIKWQAFIKKNIFDPAGMEQSLITDGAYPQTGVAHAYIAVNGKYQESDYGEFPTFCAAGNGGIWCSMVDLRKYADAIQSYSFADSSIINFSKLVSQTPNWQGEKPLKQGYCWFVGRVSPEEDLIIDHAGSQGGFRSHLIFVPEKELIVIHITNNDVFLTPFLIKTMKEFGYLKTNRWSK